MFNYYIMKAIGNFGLTSARPIYEKAIEMLPEKSCRLMGLKYIELELKLGEVERSRALFAYLSALCDPRLDADFWQQWQAFEVKHGNEETFKEMLRIKRSVQAKFNTDVEFLSAQILANRQATTSASSGSSEEIQMEEESQAIGISQLVAKPSETFIAGGKTMNGRLIDDAAEETPAIVVANPEEIAMDDD